MKGQEQPADPRRLAFQILDRVDRGGAFASILLEQCAHRLHDSRDVALLNELVLGVLRERAALDHAIEQVASRPLARTDAELLTLLRIGAYSLLFLDRVPAFAAVDTAVKLTRQSRRASGAGFVNAVLRKISRVGKSLLPPEPAYGDVIGLANWSSHPTWWVARTVERLGWEPSVRLTKSNNQPAPTVLRTRRSRVSPESLARRLATEGVGVEHGHFLPEALRVQFGVASRTSAFQEGLYWMQDEASQLVGVLAAAIGGNRIADLCAAPGGKTLLIADSLPSDGVIIAVDRHEGRIRRLVANKKRVVDDRLLVVVADAAAAVPLRGQFDVVLVDAPCSGTGTLRRHPEIRWRLRELDLQALAERQERLLESAASLILPGGHLVYSVCSVEPEEGEAVVANFIHRHGDFGVVDPRPLLPSGCHPLVGADDAVRTGTAGHGLDGFFAAVLTKSAKRM